MKKLPYLYSHLSGSSTYEEAFKELGKGKYYLGQLKLFMHELFFLTSYSKPGDKVLYIGSAPGYHINYLIKLFPDLTWDLWDGRKTEVEPSSKVKIFQKFFKDDHAREYANHQGRLLYICDIRNLNVAKYKKTDLVKMEELVDSDLTMQAKWASIMNPVWSSLKFRALYGISHFEYLTGKIYLQPYSPVSEETRLVTNNYTKFKTYNCQEFDERMANFHLTVRYGNITYKKYSKLLSQNKIINCWDNVMAFHIIDFYLKKYNKKNIVKMFNDVIDFHVKQYGKERYHVLYETKGGSRIHNLTIQNPSFCRVFDLIKKGLKPVEGRKNSLKYQEYKVGDVINLISSDGNQLKVEITDIKKYHNVKEYLEKETIDKALPGCVKSIDEAVRLYEKWVPANEIKRLAAKNNGYGFLGIHIKPL